MNVEVGATQHTAASSPQRSWLVVAGIARPVTVQAVVPRERDARAAAALTMAIKETSQSRPSRTLPRNQKSCEPAYLAAISLPWRPGERRLLLQGGPRPTDLAPI